MYLQYEDDEQSRPSTNPDKQNKHSFDIAADEYITRVIFYSVDSKSEALGVQLFTQNGRKMECGSLAGIQNEYTGPQLAGFAGRMGWALNTIWCIWEGQPLKIPGMNTRFTPHL